MTTLFPVSNGQVIDAADINQMVNLLTGVSGDTIDPRALPPAGGATPTTRGAVVLREINVCDPAYGADPTGATDSTGAFKAAFAAAIGGPAPGDPGCPIRLLFDASVQSGSAAVACASGAFSSPGDVGKSVNIPGAGNFGTQFYAAIASVTDGQHIVLDRPCGFTATGLTLVYGTQLQTRTARGSVFAPAGTYQIRADLMAVGVDRFTFRGAGPATELQATGSVIKHLLYLNGVADGDIGDFLVTGDSSLPAPGTAALAEAVSYQWTGYANDFAGGGTDSPHNLIQRTSSRLTVGPLTIQNCVFVTGIAIATHSADLQADQTLLIHPIVYGPSTNAFSNATPQDATYWQDGIVLGSGTSGNADILDLLGAKVFFCTRGVTPNQAKGFSIVGGGTQGCGTDLMPTVESYALWQGLRAEGSGTLLGSRGGTSISSNISLRDADWHGNQIITGGKIGEFDNTGVLMLDTFRIENTGSVIPYLNISPGTTDNNQRASLLLRSVSTPASLTQFARGTARAAVVSLGYTQHDQQSMVAYAHDPGLTLLGTAQPVVRLDNTVPGCTGSGATAYPVQNPTTGALDSLIVANPGLGYAAGGVAPGVAIVANHGTGAVFTAILAGDGVGSFTQVSGGGGYDALPFSGPMISAGSLTGSSLPSLIDVALFRAGPSQWQTSGNLQIGADGFANRNVTVTSTILGGTAVLSGNSLAFNRPGIATVGTTAAGSALLLQTPNTAGTQLMTRLEVIAADISSLDIFNSSLNVKYQDAATNTQPFVASWTHRPLTNQIPAASYGLQVAMSSYDDQATVDQLQASLASSWVSAAHLSRKARFALSVYDTAAREVLRGEASGTAPLLGFFGAAAVARPSLAVAATDPASTQALANSLRSALIALGLGA